MTEKTERASDSPEQISAEEALKRMKTFAERKERFIAAIKESKDRDLPAGTRAE
jgi:hypothetical protein